MHTGMSWTKLMMNLDHRSKSDLPHSSDISGICLACFFTKHENNNMNLTLGCWWLGHFGKVFLWKGSTFLGGFVVFFRYCLPPKELGVCLIHLTIYLDLFKVIFYFVPWDSSLLFTTMWENMFTCFQASNKQIQIYHIFPHGCGEK